MTSCVSTPPGDIPGDTNASAGADRQTPRQDSRKKPNSAEKPETSTEIILSSYAQGKQDAQQTLEELEKITEKTPQDRLMYAIMLRGSQRMDDSRRELEVVLAEEPDNTLAMFNLALVEHAQGNEEARDGALEIVLNADEGMSEAYALKGKIETERENFRIAEENFRKSLEIEPNYVESLVGLAWLRARRDKLKDALALLNRALEIEPNYVYALSDRSRVNAVLGNYNDAENDISRAIELEPGGSWHYLDRARIRLRYFRNLEDARADLEMVERLSPGNFFAIVYLAGLHDELRNFELAENYYRQVLEQHDNYPWAYMPMGKFAWMRGDYEAAAGFFAQASQRDGGKDVFLRLMVALSMERLGNEAAVKARRALSKILADYELGSVHYEVIRFCIEKGTDFYAVNALNKEVDEVVRERLWFYMGWTYLLDGNKESAMAVFERIAMMRGFMEYDMALAELGRIHEERVEGVVEVKK